MNEFGKELIDGFVGWVQTNGMAIGMRVLAASVILVGGVVAIGLMRKVLVKALSRIGSERKTAATFVVSVVVKSAWSVLFVVVLSKLGVNVGPIIAGLGVTGFIVGFAFQESLGSLASGLMIALNQPFKIGDYVIVGGYEGTVRKLDMMAVTLATGDNRRITVPNKNAWGSPIVNYSAMEIRRVDLAVGVAYGSDLGRARSVAIDAVKAIEGVLADPAPMAEVKSLDDSAVMMTVRFWVKNPDYWPAFFAGNRKLKESFDVAGISIPFNQLDVNIRNANGKVCL